MLFSSLTFLLFFLPAVLLLMLPPNLRWRNAMLLLSSLVFYAWGGVSMALILVFSILLNHLFALQIRHGKKNWLILGISIQVLILVGFKYIDFLLGNMAEFVQIFAPNTSYKPLGIKLPLGISFFTFQGISMLIDIYRKPDATKIKLHETALYISFFPQLIAGPIIRYHDIIDQIRDRIFNWTHVQIGFQRFVFGLFKKVAIANPLGQLTDQLIETDIQLLDASAAWLGIMAYAMQIFFDFSGYSDMAIGLGKMVGFDIAENFNFPYIARNIQDFWRRWHISLSTWFRDYVYIPLGGSKHGNWKTYRNLIFVFFLTGFWHGAAWTFIFWGLFHGAFLIFERIGGSKILEKLPRFVQHLYTLLIVLIGWVYFRIDDFEIATSYVGQLFSTNSTATLKAIYFFDLEIVMVFVVGILLCIPRKSIPFLTRLTLENSFFSPIKSFLTPILLAYCLLMLTGNTYNPFIYFRF